MSLHTDISVLYDHTTVLIMLMGIVVNQAFPCLHGESHNTTLTIPWRELLRKTMLGELYSMNLLTLRLHVVLTLQLVVFDIWQCWYIFCYYIQGTRKPLDFNNDLKLFKNKAAKIKFVILPWIVGAKKGTSLNTCNGTKNVRVQIDNSTLTQPLSDQKCGR